MQKKSHPLRICIFNWRDPWDPKAGGAEQVTLEHAKFWAEKGHYVVWISGTYPHYIKKETKYGISFHRIGSSSTLFLRAWAIYWFMYLGNFDVIVDEVHGLPMFSPLWAWRSKRIVLIHEVAQEIWDEMFQFPVNVIGKWMELKIFPFLYRHTKFWVDCASTKKDLVAIGILTKNVSVILCAIDPVPLQNVPKEKNFTCIFLSRLVKMKGIESALIAFSYIHETLPTAQFWIVGDGEQKYVDVLRTKVEQLHLKNAVKFWGRVDEHQKYNLLARARLLIHTSVREGFGLTVLEANSQKTPALVFDVAALRDIVKDGQTGFISPFMDTHHLATQALLLYGNPQMYEKIAAQAYQYSTQFRWPTFTQQSLDLLESL